MLKDLCISWISAAERKIALDRKAISCEASDMKVIAICAMLAIPAICSCGGQPSGIAPCTVPPGVRSTLRQADLPRPVRDALLQKVGVIVPPNSRFDSSDAVSTSSPHFRRLIFIWNKGDRWIIATERGGRAYSDPIFSYKVNSDGAPAMLLLERSARKETVCSTAEAMLNE